jgi:hypothetical protein
LPAASSARSAGVRARILPIASLYRPVFGILLPRCQPC